MNVAVWDTYVLREEGNYMHFDILVPDEVSNEKIVFSYGKTYLKTKAFKTGSISAKECRLCHIEKATEEIENTIKKQGFFIIEMENCN